MIKLLRKFKNSDLGYVLFKDKTAMTSLIVLLIIILIATFANFLSPFDPHNPLTIDLLDAETPPYWMDGGVSKYILGTDEQGRDLLSSIFYGLRLSLIIGLGAIVIQTVIGTILGLFAGYYGGKIDSIIMRAADVQLSFSSTMVAIIALAIVQNAFSTEFYSNYAMYILMIIIGISMWPNYARTVRSCVLNEVKQEYVEASKVLMVSNRRIIFRHIFPNTLSPLLVLSTIATADAIVTEAALSFLGLGMPPGHPSLGSLISSGFNYIFNGSWWITIIPGLVLVVLILAINLLGDFLRDYFNPKIYKD